MQFGFRLWFRILTDGNWVGLVCFVCVQPSLVRPCKPSVLALCPAPPGMSLFPLTLEFKEVKVTMPTSFRVVMDWMMLEALEDYRTQYEVVF